MSNPSNTAPALLPHYDVEVVTDPKQIEAAYQNDIYDPRRDVRNQYPMIAQQMLFDPKMREGLAAAARDVCDSGMFGYKATDRDLAAVRTVAIKGFAMGLDFPRALECIKVIHGTPTIRGPQALHLIRERARGAIVECLESSAEVAVWSLARPGEKPKQFRGTREQVNRAKLPEKNNLWNVYPERLLKWHAFSEGAQELFGDVLMGCYITEEMALENQFDRDMDDAILRDQEARKKANRAARKSTPPEPRHPAPQTGAPDASDSPARAAPTQIKNLGHMLARLGQLLGMTQPNEEMSTEEKEAAQQEWAQERQLLWESVSKQVLDGKVAKSESITEPEYHLLRVEFERRIDAETTDANT